MILKLIPKLLGKAIVKTIEHDGVEHSGYMSFMVILSIFPFIVFFLAFTSFFNASELGSSLTQLLLDNMPNHSIDAIKTRINEIAQSPPQSLLTLAIFGSIWTASSFVECLRTILNRVYEIKSPPPYIRRRLLSILQFIIISLLFCFAMMILVLLPILFRKIPNIVKVIEGYEYIIGTIRYCLILLSLFLGAASFYYIIPNARINFSSVAPGAFLVSILWVLSGYLLSSYIQYYNQLNVIYGSLGNIIVTLLFFYIINMLFIYGAEFNKLLQDAKSKSTSN